MKKRTIAVVTGSRAEYGHLFFLLRRLRADGRVRLQLLVTGTHLCGRFGNTRQQIQEDGFAVKESIPILGSGDTAADTAAAIGRGVMRFARVYAKLRPHLIVVLGDRFELLAAVSAAIPFCIPIAHIHGGELTEGAFDDPIRHAITKMSHLHFASTATYRRRIIQMGEDPSRVVRTAAPGLATIRQIKLMSREQLCSSLEIPERFPLGIATFHPETLEPRYGLPGLLALHDAAASFPGIFWIWTYANADTGNARIIKETERFVARHPAHNRLFVNLGQRKFLSLMKYAAVMVGNSSSGIIEAPSFELPVVNIGSRQRGRIRAGNVIDVPGPDPAALRTALTRATSPSFRRELSGLRNPYGNGCASTKIAETLATFPLGPSLIQKGFFDLTPERRTK